MESVSIFQAYSDYILVDNHRSRKSMLLSVITRYLIDIWGGVSPKGNRATTRELLNIEEFMKSLPITLLINSLEVLEKAYLAKGKTKQEMRSYKSEYNNFLKWVELNNYYTKFLPEIISNEVDIETKIFNRRINGTGKKPLNNHGKVLKPPFALMAVYKGTGKNSGELIYPNDYINNNLECQLKLFEAFRLEKHHCSKGTVNFNIINIYRILGWLHRYKNIPLDELSLTSIIRFIKLNISLNEFKDKQGKFNYQEYTIAKAMTRQNAIDIANENKNLIKEYLDFIEGHAGTKVIAVTTFIAVAKFIFKDEVETDEYIDDSELPIIKRLNQLCNNLQKTNKISDPLIPHSEKSVSWIEALKVLEILRKRSDCLFNPNSNIRRSKSAISDDLQSFLSLAFMLVIPTDRARTYYELEINKTFVYGLYKDGRFISFQKLQDKNQACWYIHLKPNDYKTGKTYKEYWGLMPNVPFPDDKTLYEYIDRWITQERECEQKCSHNRFFRKNRNYQVLDSKNWCERIRTIFNSETGVPVTPKEIRKMYITHINNKRASNAELKGAAYSMHHSTKMQEEVYNIQNSFDKVAPTMELNERIWQEIHGLKNKEN